MTELPFNQPAGRAFGPVAKVSMDHSSQKSKASEPMEIDQSRSSQGENDDDDEVMLIEAMTPNGSIHVDARSSETIEMLKSKIAQKIRNDNRPNMRIFEQIENQRLIFNGMIPTPDSKLLRDIPHLSSGSVVHLVQRHPEPTRTVAQSDNLQERAVSARVKQNL